MNDHEIPAIVAHALERGCVRGVTFQPVQDAGRNDGFDAQRHRITLTEIRRRIAEAGVFALDDLIPLPCNPDQICTGYGVRNGRAVAPVTAMLPRELFFAAVPNTVSFEAYPELKERMFRLLSLSTAQALEHGWQALWVSWLLLIGILPCALGVVIAWKRLAMMLSADRNPR